MGSCPSGDQVVLVGVVLVGNRLVESRTSGELSSVGLSWYASWVVMYCLDNKINKTDIHGLLSFNTHDQTNITVSYLSSSLDYGFDNGINSHITYQIHKLANYKSYKTQRHASFLCLANAVTLPRS